MADETTNTAQQTDTAAGEGSEQHTGDSAQDQAQDQGGKSLLTGKETGAEGAAEGGQEGGDANQGDDGGDKGEGAPESYEAFTAPEGSLLDGVEVVKEFGETFKGLNLTQEQAQNLVSKYAEYQAKQNEASDKALADQQAAWQKEAKDDPDFKGNQAKCLAAIKEYGDDDLKALLDSAWGDNPAVRRFLAKVGAPLVNGRVIEGDGRGEKTDRQKLAERYPTMKIE